MNVPLTPLMEQFVRREVESGRHQSAAEVVGEALRLLEKQEEVRRAELLEFRSEIDRRLAKADAGETIDGEDFFHTLRRKPEERCQ